MKQIKKVKGQIQFYTKNAREQIINLGKQVLDHVDFNEIGEDLFSCVDELIKNSVKANYKFLLIKEKLHEYLTAKHPGKEPDEINNAVNEIIDDYDKFNSVATEILTRTNIPETVRKILNEESKCLCIKNRAYDENREITPDEKIELKEQKYFRKIREKIHDSGIMIILKMQSDPCYIYVEITNTAPMLIKDLNRIHEKRNEHRKLREQGREYEFFINNLDTSEAGFGLGYAKIDSFLAEWGLNPHDAATIISAIDTTVMLTIPVNVLQKKMLVNQKN